MSDIGQELKQAREQLGLTIEEIYSRTMIPKKYLTALEEENFSLFPGEVYLKGALRKYASELGLNAQDFMDRYNGSKESSLPDAAEKKAETTIAADSSEKKESKVYGAGKSFSIKGLLTIIFIVFILAAGAYTVMRLINMEKQPPSDPPPLTDQQPNGENNRQEEEDPEQNENRPEQPEPPAVQVERDSTTDSVRFIVRNAANIEANMMFSEACWIRVTADGNHYFEGTLQAEQSKEADASREISIRIGNPPSMTLTVNGQAVELPDTQYSYTLQIVSE